MIPQRPHDFLSLPNGRGIGLETEDPSSECTLHTLRFGVRVGVGTHSYRSSHCVDECIESEIPGHRDDPWSPTGEFDRQHVAVDGRWLVAVSAHAVEQTAGTANPAALALPG